MKIKILAKNIELTSELKLYIENKVNSLESKLGKEKQNEDRNCNFRIGQGSASKNSGNIFFAEANIETLHKNYGAKAEANSVQEAIDKLKDELSRKIRKYKNKKESFLKKGGRATKKLLQKLMR